MNEPRIEHHPDRQRFTLSVDGKEAVLQYEISEGSAEATGRVNFTHTYVPPELRNQGLAEALVRQGISWAQQQQYEMRASCWYAAKFLPPQ